MDMTNLQSLSVFLTERLTLAAQEIFKAVEVTVTEYHDEISRSRQENELLKTRLLEAGIEFYSELQPSASALHEGVTSVGRQPRAEHWGEEGADIQVKLELSATKDEATVSHAHAPVAKEPSCPDPWPENEARVEEAFHTLMTESDVSTLLHAAPFVQDVKEEPEDSGSDLRTAATIESQACTAASNQACGLEDDMESHRLTSMHKALRSKLPVTGRPGVALHKRCINYDPVGPDRELTQRRESFRYRMKRARGKSKLLKVGRERKVEKSTEQQSACRRSKESLADVTLLDEDQSAPSQFEASLGDLAEEMSENGQEPSGTWRVGVPAEDEGFAGTNLCVVCGRTFSSRGLLKIHLRVHSGEKPYHCHFCDKNFRQSSHLNVHVRIHTGEKPYSCPTCGKRFSDRSARNRHLKVHLESAEDNHS